MEVIYNILMAGFVASAVRLIKFRPTPGVAALAALGVGFGGSILAALLGGDIFGVMRNCAYAVFVWVPVVLSAAAWLLRTRRGWAIAAGAVVVVLCATAVSAFLVEPHRLEERTVRIESSKVKAPLKIALLADLQTDSIGEYERDVVRRMMAAKPDLILHAGDYLQIYGKGRAEQVAKMRELFKDVTAPLGIYAVQGNVDPDDWTTLFESGVTCMHRTESVVTGKIRITGLSLKDSFEASTHPVERDDGRFHIVMGHAPDFALANPPADLIVAGHTHGGQVQLPFIGPLITLSDVPRSWAHGVTSFPDGRTLVVSRGVGMERGHAPRLRFLCRPELVYIEVVPTGR